MEENRTEDADEDPRAHMRVFFSGIVQGVFFRASTRKEALRLGLKGWVRNLPDGTVEAYIEGERRSIERLIDFCSGGIPMARVDSVDARWGPYTDDFSTFEIVR